MSDIDSYHKQLIEDEVRKNLVVRLSKSGPDEDGDIFVEVGLFWSGSFICDESVYIRVTEPTP